MKIFSLVIEPPAGGRYEHRLGAGSYVLGREQGTCDLAIVSPEISRRHVQLTLSETQCTVKDLGSTSGTYHSGEAVRESRALPYPLELHLGTVRLSITLVTQQSGDTNGSGVAGHYMKGAEIAKGGMGAVLEANDQLLGRTVAMKVVRHDIGDSESIRLRFIREATVLARLEHPSIVPIYEMGKDAEGRLYYTMKMVEGRTLQAILDDLQAGHAATVKEFTLDRLLNIFRKICEAMAFAHAKGVIHRDLKPENVMVGEYGEVLVMDWGLAKILQDVAQSAVELQLSTQVPGSASGTQMPTGFQELSDSQMSGSSQNLTLDGAVMGSPQYMPPEQAEGKVGEIDERSDIFSLGGILYAILTLKPPVEGRTIKEVLENVKSGKITPPTHFNAASTVTGASKISPGGVQDPGLAAALPHCPGGKVPVALSAVSMKALAMDPARRYASVGELISDIDKYLGGFATSAEDIGELGKTLLLIKRHKVIASAAVLIVVLTAGFMVRLIASGRETRQQAAIAADNAGKAREEARRAQGAEEIARQKEEAARLALARAAINLAEASQREGDTPAMQAALREVPESLRDSTWDYLSEQSDTSVARLRLDPSGIRAAAPDPARPSVFAVTDRTPNVTLLNVRTGARLLKFAPGLKKLDSNSCLAFSPDGERIAVGTSGSTGGIAIHNARNGKKLLDWESSPSGQLAFSRDGRQLLVHDRVRIHMWDSMTGTLLWSYPPTNRSSATVCGAFIGDGQQVVITEWPEMIRLLNAGDGKVIRTLSRSRTLNRVLVGSADGTVTGVGESGVVTHIDLQQERVVSDFRAGASSYHVAAAGPLVATAVVMADGRQDIRVWDGSTGIALKSLLGGQGELRQISLHPLSGELLVCGTDSRVWVVASSPEKWAFYTRSRFQINFAFASDDIIFGPLNTQHVGLLNPFGDGTATVWSAPVNTRTAVFSRDGRIGFVGSPYRKDLDVFRNVSGSAMKITTVPMKAGADFLRLNQSGDRLAAIYGQAVTVLDTATMNETVNLRHNDVQKIWDLVWTTGGRLVGLVTAKDKRGSSASEEWIVAWDAATGKLLQTVTNRTANYALAVSPDGRRFAEGGADKTVRIRDAITLAVLQEFRAHNGPITALAWHPTKPILATASADLSIRLWNLEDGRRFEELNGPVSAPNSLAFSPGGRRVGCACTDGSTRVWEPVSLR